MPLRSWILFITVVITLLSLIHGFILFHLWPLFGESPFRWLALTAMILLGGCYMAGRALESHSPRLSLPLLHIGSWWLGMMAYLFLGCFLLDLLFFLNCILPILPVDYLPWLQRYFVILGVVIAIGMLAGHLNVQFPTIRKLTIPSLAGLRIVVASDIHLCGLVSVKRINRVVDHINAQEPDLILLPGDTIDENLNRSPRSGDFRHALKRLNAPQGIIAVTGNHEWINGVDVTTSWLESCGIIVLRDQVLDLGSLLVAGRDDVASARINKKTAVSLDQILAGIDHQKPLIVLDHQPTRIQDAVNAQADLLLCGHTHHGQFWPFQWITKHIFTISHGHRKIENTDVYVSCGAGAWGPQIRTSSRSEILVLSK